jgi:uncharacterized protein YlxW (UPF0749 family)
MTGSPAEPTRPRTTAVLDDLLRNTLDPGYQAASAHGASKRWWDGPMVWLACVVVGLILTMAYQQSHLSAPARDTARTDLITRIRNLQKTGAGLDVDAKQLAGQVAALRDAQLAAAGSPDLRALEVLSGSVAVHGPGMSVELGEPPQADASNGAGRTGTQPQAQVAVLHDRDIRAVVNQLWAGGAEAISVNGIRLTPTSAIRFAGDAILVDFQTIGAPYTIQAIGDRNRMILDFADSAIARQLKTAEAVYGISFAFEGRSKLQLSSVTVAEPRYASTGPAPSPSPSPTATESPR